MRRGGDASSSAAQPDVGTSLSGLSFIKILFRACRERREREPAEPLAREPSPPFSRHYQRTLATPSSRASHARSRSPRGCFVARTIRVVIYFFSFTLLRTVSRRYPFVCLSVRSFVFVHFSGPIEEQDKKRGQCQEDRTPRRHQKARHLLKFVVKNGERNWVFVVRD